MPELLEMTKEVTQDERRVTCLLPLRERNRIITLDQVRKTKPSRAESETMLQSFLHSGQHVPGIIAVLTRPQMKNYLGQIGGLWGKTYNIENYQPALWEGKIRYFVLIAGHMRLATANRIIELLDTGALKNPDRFKEMYYAELRFGLTAERAIEIQISENFHHPVHPMDEIYAAQKVYMWKQSLGEKFSLADLARMFSRGSGWASEAMMMGELPEEIQQLAIAPGEEDQGRPEVARGILLNVARLQRSRKRQGVEMTVRDMAEEVSRAVRDKMSPSAHAKKVTSIIQHEEGNNGQATMDLVGGFSSGPLTRTGRIRDTVAPGIAESTAALVQGLEIFMHMFDRGLYGSIDDPDSFPLAPEVDEHLLEQFAFGSPIANMGKLADLWYQLAPYMLAYAKAEGGRGRKQIEDALEAAGITRQMLSALLDREPLPFEQPKVVGESG